MDPPGAPCLINLLPTELLYRIFASLDDPKALCRAERTCHRWRSIINSQALWRSLAMQISSARILPEKFNELGKGSLITGTYIEDEEGGHWNYMYRDLVRNIHCLNRISNMSNNESQNEVGQENEVYPKEKESSEPKINQAPSFMQELSKLPSDYAGSKDAYVTRKIDFTSSAIEGMRLQPRPLLISKTPPFTDSLCPGETSSDETAWVYFADQLALWPRPHNDIIFETPPVEKCTTTIQKGVLRTGTNGIFGTGTWLWPNPPEHQGSSDQPTAGSPEEEKAGPSSTPQKRPWKDTENSNTTGHSIGEDIERHSAKERILFTELQPSPDPVYPSGHLKWAAPIDSSKTLPHARRWDPNSTIFGSYRNIFDLTPEKNPECKTPMVVESAINTLYGEVSSQAHSDPNLRIHYQRLKSTFPDMIAVKVDRLALPPVQSITKDPHRPVEPIPIVNQSWNLFGGAKWSLNSVSFLEEGALDLQRTDGPASSSSEPWWFHETRYRTGAEEPPNIWESAHKWEYRSCGDYLIISDDIGMSGPCTISCFKTGYHEEKSTVDPTTYLRGAALRNYFAAGPSSDLIWQKSLKCGGYILDPASKSAVHSLQHPDFAQGHPSYFLDNDGLTINSKVVVYATRKKVFFTLNPSNVIIFEASGQSLTCMEFHVIAIETGHTINILDLEHETRFLESRSLSWYGWASFVMSDTHLMATVGGNVHQLEGAENLDDSVAVTWVRGNRYGREEVFIWPLDTSNQNLSLAPEERKILPTGRLAVGLNKHKWWRKDRYLSLSRDGRFLTASSKYTLVVWDLWLGDTDGVVYSFDQYVNGLQGYNLSIIGDVAWNGIWLQYRDIIVDPNHTTFTNSNPNHEHELLRKTIFIPNSEVRLLLQSTDRDFEKTDPGRVVANDLDGKLNRRYAPSDSDSDESSNSWTTDDDDGDGNYEDSDDYDSDGGGFRSQRYADDDDWEEGDEYDEDYGNDDDDGQYGDADDDEDDDDSGDSIAAFTVQHVRQPDENSEQPPSVKKRKLETTQTGAGEPSASGSNNRQDPVPVVGWGDADNGDRAADGWGTDNEGGTVDETW
ncbi:hypothetical protein TWF718_005367 [Orbilia javanica]|uniref:F-box domain-containing protein n=1 Tax=Orbilia javanica TaxID=47235 RepID=A0AAN8NWT1_9PEZI